MTTPQPRVTRASTAAKPAPPINSRTAQKTATHTNIRISNSSDGITFLEANALRNSGSPTTLESIVATLLNIAKLSQAALPLVTNAIQAVAFVLQDMEIDEKAKYITDAVIRQVKEDMKEKKEKETAEMEKRLEEMKEVHGKCMGALGALEEMQEKMEAIATAPTAPSDDHLHSTATTPPTHVPPTVPSPSPGIPTANPTATRRSATRSPKPRPRTRYWHSQLLLDVRPDSLLATRRYANATLSEKANTALDSLTPPPHLKGCFTSAFRLHNGGIILRTNSHNAAEWIRTRKDQFAEAFDEGAQIKDRTFSVMVPDAPLSLELDEESLNDIESVNRMNSGDIINAKWMKHPRRSDPDQTTSHLIMTFRSANTANAIIQNGIRLRHQKIRARRLKREPTRCYKCQEYGHHAASCLSEERCGTCGRSEHQTTDCTYIDPSFRQFCTPCGDMGHASWSKDCPEFIRRSQEIRIRDPENSMPFFPTDDVDSQ